MLQTCLEMRHSIKVTVAKWIFCTFHHAAHGFESQAHVLCSASAVQNLNDTLFVKWIVKKKNWKQEVWVGPNKNNRFILFYCSWKITVEGKLALLLYVSFVLNFVEMLIVKITKNASRITGGTKKYFYPMTATATVALICKTSRKFFHVNFTALNHS